MNKEKIIKNVVNGIDDQILESGKAVVCLEDIYNNMDLDLKEFFVDEKEFTKEVKEELNTQNYEIDTDDNYEKGTLIVTKEIEE